MANYNVTTNPATVYPPPSGAPADVVAHETDHGVINALVELFDDSMAAATAGYVPVWSGSAYVSRALAAADVGAAPQAQVTAINPTGGQLQGTTTVPSAPYTTDPTAPSGFSVPAAILGTAEVRSQSGDLAVGTAAQRSLTTGGNNSAFGYAAQRSLTTGGSNSAFGTTAQNSLTTGSNNSAFGSTAQNSLTTGSSNSAFGTTAQNSLTTGSSDSAFGYAAQNSLTTGGSASAFGTAAQYSLTTGGSDSAFGSTAQYSLTTGSSDSAFGYAAQRSLTTGSNNSAFGSTAQYSPAGITANATTSANFQTCLGYQTGQATATQVDYITAVGANAVAGTAGATALGAGAQALHSNSVAIGQNTATTQPNQVHVGARNVESSLGFGPVISAPDGTRWRLTVATGGALSTIAA